MTRTTTVPDETDLLCENCGYNLNGLPTDSRCPECGEPIANSLADKRRSPEWEQSDSPKSSTVRFLSTLSAVVFRPAAFYRSLNTRTDSPRSRSFARILWAAISVQFAAAAYWHADLFIHDGSAHHASPLLIPLFFVLTFTFLAGINRLAAKLTAWEAAYWGMRLPHRAVVGALDYHSAHYLPVALVALVTVGGYCALRGIYFTAASGPAYLYVLSGEVVLGAFYLFQTYWIGMRRMMYANG